jgi:hypothetical protein
MSGIWHFVEKLQKKNRIPPSEIPLFGEPLEKSGIIGSDWRVRKIGKYWELSGSQFFRIIPKLGIIGNQFC